MPSRPNPAADNRHAYVPAAAQAAMAQQMQHVPAHLKQYVGANKPAYVPERVQHELTAFMQKSTPAHLQQYAGAYVQQNVVDPSLRTPVAPTSNRAPAPLPDKRNLSHSGDVAAAQADATQYLNMFKADAPTVAAASQEPNSSYTPPPPPGSPYDFFMEQQPARPKKFNFGGSSMAMRILLVVGGLFVLLIVFSVIKGALSGSGSSSTSLIGVTQDQQALVHLANSGSQNATSDTLKDFSATALISLQSEQDQLVVYLQANGHKVGGKELSLKVSKTTDSELSAAQSASNFDQTYKSVMEDRLKAYQADVQKAYNETRGPKGQALLSDDFKAAGLLLQQLDS